MESNNFKHQYIQVFQSYICIIHNYNLKVNLDYKGIILMNFLKELMQSDDTTIIDSLKQIILQRCEEAYYDEYRKYKHHPNEQKLRDNIKSIDIRFDQFMSFVKNN